MRFPASPSDTIGGAQPSSVLPLPNPGSWLTRVPPPTGARFFATATPGHHLAAPIQYRSLLCPATHFSPGVSPTAVGRNVEVDATLRPSAPAQHGGWDCLTRRSNRVGVRSGLLLAVAEGVLEENRVYLDAYAFPLQPHYKPGCSDRRNCSVNLDELRWDRPKLDCQPQQEGVSPRNLQLDETRPSCLVQSNFAKSRLALRRMLRCPDLGSESLSGQGLRDAP
jgi:hypothetical protein